MAKIPLEFGGLSFPTKSSAYEHFRQMLYSHQVGSSIPEPDTTELMWLLERHPEVDDKLGCGVDHFSVRDALYGTRCFEIVRKDGSTTDFSFKSCIEGRRPSCLGDP